MFNRRELARLSVFGAAASLAAPAFAQTAGSVAFHPLSSDNVPGQLGMAVYHPPGYRAGADEPYPLLLLLHGGHGSERDMLYFTDVFDAEIAVGRLPPMVIAMPSARTALVEWHQIAA